MNTDWKLRWDMGEQGYWVSTGVMVIDGFNVQLFRVSRSYFDRTYHNLYRRIAADNEQWRWVETFRSIKEARHRAAEIVADPEYVLPTVRAQNAQAQAAADEDH